MENRLVIAFDVDDTLIVPAIATGLDRDTPNYETISIYKWFQLQGHFMIIWSGSGIDYAIAWANKLGLNPDSVRIKKRDEIIDMAFDDCDVNLAQVNIKVKRINNSISRKEWNENKTG